MNDKEILSDLARRTGAIATDICKQLNNIEVQLRDKYLLGIMNRHSIILEDVANILSQKHESRLMSAFILSRCLLDDFLTILYFHNKQYDNSVFINHTSEAYKQKLKMVTESRKINEKYFEGKQIGMATKEIERGQYESFCSIESNKILFKNFKKREFKSFPKTGSAFAELIKSDTNAASANSYVLWKFFSQYVHYSLVTYELEQAKGARQIEVRQLKEVLSYCYKTIFMASSALVQFGHPHIFNDPTNVFEAIMKGREVPKT
ncbi:MAG: hypothetical protein JSS79_15730 [Bacteroidetes bacterium]|nr:hypothetical protein [Bacteroidota bacterium]